MKNETTEAIKLVREFMPTSQFQAMRAGLRGEESQYFADKFMEMATTILTMPKTYEQDGLGDKAVAHLHYFKGGADWYITEKDTEADEYSQQSPGQHQAFGLANLGYGAELGYISIVELVGAGVELDLHFKPKTLAELKERAVA